VLLSLFAIMATGVADYLGPEDESNLEFREIRNLTFSMDQSVNGNGFFSTYQYSKMPDDLGDEGRLFNGVEAKGRAHGSGTVETDSQVYAESSYKNESYFNAEYDDDGEPYDELEETTCIIRLKDDTNQVYAPSALSLGSRFYSRNPLVFNSLLSEESWIKNRDGLNSMIHRIDRAHGLDKLFEAKSDATVISMNVDEDLTEGRAHFGVLQLPGTPRDEEAEESDSEDEIEILGLAMKTWKKPLIEVDWDYVGSFHIVKKMEITTSSEEEEEEESWLPCCSGGYADLNPLDQGSWSAQGIFDCTCARG